MAKYEHREENYIFKYHLVDGKLDKRDVAAIDELVKDGWNICAMEPIQDIIIKTIGKRITLDRPIS